MRDGAKFLLCSSYRRTQGLYLRWDLRHSSASLSYSGICLSIYAGLVQWMISAGESCFGDHDAMLSKYSSVYCLMFATYLNSYTTGPRFCVCTKSDSLSGSQIPIHNIIQHRQPLLLRLHPRPLQPPRIRLRLSRHPPRRQRHQRTQPHEAHGTRKTLLVPWRILLPEDLWSNRSTNLSVAVTKPMPKADPVAREVVWTRQGHMSGKKAAVKALPISVAAYTAPFEG